MEFSAHGPWSIWYQMSCPTPTSLMVVSIYDAASGDQSQSDPPVTITGPNQMGSIPELVGGQFEVQIATPSCSWRIAAFQ